MENLVMHWRKKRRVLQSLRAVCVHSVEPWGANGTAGSIGATGANGATGPKAAKTATADFILLHPCFGMGHAGDPSGLLLGHAQMDNANAAAEALYLSLPAPMRDLPLALGVCAVDPFLLIEPALKRWRYAGVKGVTNLPTVGALDGLFRADLEANGLGFDREVAFLALAKSQGFFTVGHAFTAVEAEKFAKAEVDAVIAHLGWQGGDTSGTLRPKSLAGQLREWRSLVGAARKFKPDALVLLHGDHVMNDADAGVLRSEAFEGDGVVHLGG